MAGSEKKMGALHSMLLDMFISEVEWYNSDKNEHNLPMPAADKAVIAKFLKDNAITCEPEKRDDLDALREKIMNKREGQRTEAIRQALELSEDDIREQYGLN